MSTGKFLLFPIPSVPSGGMIGFAKAVTLPIRGVVDLTGRLIKRETGATMNPVEKPKKDGDAPRFYLNPSPVEAWKRAQKNRQRRLVVKFCNDIV